MLNVIMLNVVMLNVIMLNVVMLNVIMLSVSALLKDIQGIAYCVSLPVPMKKSLMTLKPPKQRWHHDSSLLQKGLLQVSKFYNIDLWMDWPLDNQSMQR